MSKKMFKLSAMFIALSLTVVVSLGCSKKAAPSDVFKVGVTDWLAAPIGIEISNWFKLYAKMVNEDGGSKIGDKTYKLEMINEDHGADPTKHQAALEKLIFNDKVKFILESFGADQNQSAQIAEQNKVIILGLGFGDETAKPKFSYFYRAQGLYFLRGSNYVMYKIFKERGAKNVLLVNPDGEAGKANVAQFSTVLPVVGLEKLTPIFFPAATTDFSGVAIKVKQLNPDAIDLGAAGDDQIVNFVRALKEVGWKGQMYPGLMNANLLANLVKTVGKEYIEGFVAPYLAPKGMTTDDKEIKALVKAYPKEYNGALGEDGVYWTAPWFVFKGAVDATQSTDPEVIKKYLAGQPKAEKTVCGMVHLFARPDVGNNAACDGIPSHGIGMIKNGELVFFKRVSIKDQYIMTIICNKVQPAYKAYWEKFGKPKFADEDISNLDFKDVK